jgi:hypothetical protein
MEVAIQRAAQIFEDYPPDIATAAASLPRASKKRLHDSPALELYGKFEAALTAGDVAPVYNTYLPAQKENKGKFRLREMISFAATGSLSAVGFTVAMWAAQSVLESALYLL